MLTSTQLSGQSILINSHQVKAVLKDRAELDLRRSNAITDSVATHALLMAYMYKDSALRASVRAIEEADFKAHDYWAMNEVSKQRIEAQRKEIRKQKRLKFIFLLSGAIFVALSLH